MTLYPVESESRQILFGHGGRIHVTRMYLVYSTGYLQTLFYNLSQVERQIRK